MKILVFSDSHRNLSHMVSAVEREHPDQVIHLGDHVRDAEKLQCRYPMLPVLKIRGNCDYDAADTQEQRITEFDGVRFLICHGHRYGVKAGLLRYLMAARENQVDVALFGHTHCAFCEKESGVWLLNPGSCGAGVRPSYGLITIAAGKYTCAVHTFAELEDSL